jgi:tRNA nucleotidyltransferase (CCA-adding enzyme)
MATVHIIPHRIAPILQTIGRLADEMQMPAYAVGGCVRDWLLGVAQTQDLDVTAEGDGVVLASAVARALGGTAEPHEPFGTSTVTVPGSRHRRIDVATCRRETYARPAAYPKVSRGTLEDDLFRRDFTINAMAVSIAPGAFGALVDPFGGARDLRRRRLRILHGRSFIDDPSRILRGVRFLKRFGLRWDPATARSARDAVASGALGRLNAGRLRRELERMGQEPDPLGCLLELAGLLEG